MSSIIVWFRQDLRLEDNAAWKEALDSGLPVVPVFIWASEEAGCWQLGGASRWWLHHALVDLADQLQSVGSRLIVKKGDSDITLESLIKETGARSVYWNRCYEPHRVQLDGRIKSELKKVGVAASSWNSCLLREPWELATGAGNPYKVYTPYANACAKLDDPQPLVVNSSPAPPLSWPKSESIESLGLLPSKDWASGFSDAWDPTRKGGLQRMNTFLSHAVGDYAEGRDFPDVDGTSRLSPYLHWGQIGPREVLAAIRSKRKGVGIDIFHREIIWREFAHHVLYHFPDTPVEPLQRKFGQFPWRNKPVELKAWQNGQTGYPIVDAGMRQLWKTGWMHNRVRMIVASFLVKHLLHSWEDGALWFWDTLVDADLASNTLGWQWAGGCGADAAPYFRIFNPIIQSQKFDKAGEYIRAYVPELKDVPLTYLHTPWDMPEPVQNACGCRIGVTYPAPIIEHKLGRERALAALASIKTA